MFLTKMALPRRTFLRGMGTALALPLLDAMVPALSALAFWACSVASSLPILSAARLARLGWTDQRLILACAVAIGTRFRIPISNLIDDGVWRTSIDPHRIRTVGVRSAV